jgi:HTH-type transcriptional regulator / antitoxin MqsA
MNSCVFCGGQVESKAVTFSYQQDEHVILVKNVPAEVCSRCGEKTYSPEITDELLKFAMNRFKPLKMIEVPLFDFCNKAAATG